MQDPDAELPVYVIREPQMNSIIIKHQSPNFNTLSRVVILLTRILKSSMRHSSCPPIVCGVITLDQGDLLWRLSILEVPLMCLVRLDSESLTPTIRIDQSCANEIRLWDGMGVSNG